MITGGIANWTENRSWRYGLPGKLSKYTERFLGGSHDLKVGLQYGGHGSDQLNGPNDTITTFSVTGRAVARHDAAAVSPGREGALDRRLRRRHLPRRPRVAQPRACATTTARGCFPSFPLLDAVGNATGRDVGGERRRLPLEHVLAARRRQLPADGVGPSWSRRTTAATTRSWKHGEFRPAVPSITPSFEFGFDAGGNRINFVQTSSNANLRIDPDMKAPYSRSVHRAVRAGADDEPRLPGQLRPQARRGLRAGRTSPGSTSQVPYMDNLGIDATGDTVMVYRLHLQSGGARVPADQPRRHVHALPGRHDDGDEAHVEQLAGGVLAGAVEGGRAARLERARDADGDRRAARREPSAAKRRGRTTS